jgi:hypothetical protein
MSGPLVFITRSTVKPGMWEQQLEHDREAAEIVDSDEPRVIAFNTWSSTDQAEVSCIQVHPDADSLDTHLKIFYERLAQRVGDALDTYEIDIYGTPSDGVLESMQQVPGAQLRVHPVHLTGFLRPQPM